MLPLSSILPVIKRPNPPFSRLSFVSGMPSKPVEPIERGAYDR